MVEGIAITGDSCGDDNDGANDCCVGSMTMVVTKTIANDNRIGIRSPTDLFCNP